MSLPSLFNFITFSELLYVLLLVLVIWYVKVKFVNAPRNLPPFPEPPKFIVGHLTLMTNGPIEAIKEWRIKCGDLFCFYIGSSLHVVINGYDLHREFFVKHADAFSDIQDGFLSNIPGFKKGITTNSGPDWEEQRAVTLSILRSFGMGKNILEERITKEVSLYLKALEDLDDDETLNFLEFTDRAVANVMCSILLNHRFEYNDEFFAQMQNFTDEHRDEHALRGIPFDAFPLLKYLPCDIFNRKKIVEVLDRGASYLSDRFIKEELEADPNEKREPSFIRSYLDEMSKRQASGEHTFLDLSSLQRTVLALFEMSRETTKATLMAYMLFMSENRATQEEVCETIDTVVGRSRLPTLQDMPKLNYVNAVIMETQRHTGVASQGLQHKCSKTVTVQGYTIPEGATIVPNLSSVLMDEKIWEDPEDFRPERFLADDGSLLQPDEFILYSIGRRKCVGEDLAKMMLFLFVTSVSHRFRISENFFLRESSPFGLVFKKR